MNGVYAGIGFFLGAITWRWVMIRRFRRQLDRLQQLVRDLAQGSVAAEVILRKLDEIREIVKGGRQ